MQYHKLSESLPKSLKMNKLPDTASATSTLTLDGDNEEERNSAMGYQQTLMVSKSIFQMILPRVSNETSK